MKKRQVRYKIKPGAHIAERFAKIAALELPKIRRAHGKVTAPLLVEAATPKDHPLHDYFEWDNHKAAHEYRLAQGRRLLHGIVIEDAAISAKPIRAFVAIEEADSQADYKGIHDVLSEPELRAKYIQDAVAELREWLDRYQEMKELRTVAAAITKALSRPLSPRPLTVTTRTKKRKIA